MVLQSRCAGLPGEERLPLPELWPLRTLQLGNHRVGLTVINHWNKHRKRLFLEVFATMQAYWAIALCGCSPVRGFLFSVISTGDFRNVQGLWVPRKRDWAGKMTWYTHWGLKFRFLEPKFWRQWPSCIPRDPTGGLGGMGGKDEGTPGK